MNSGAAPIDPKYHKRRMARLAALGRVKLTLWTSASSSDALKKIAQECKLKSMGDALDYVIANLARYPELRKELGL